MLCAVHLRRGWRDVASCGVPSVGGATSHALRRGKLHRGQISTMLTGVPGVSQVFAGGVVANDNAVKRQALGVHPETLERYAAVAE